MTRPGCDFPVGLSNRDRELARGHRWLWLWLCPQSSLCPASKACEWALQRERPQSHSLTQTQTRGDRGWGCTCPPPAWEKLLLAVWPWASQWTALSFIFLICKMGILTVPTHTTAAEIKQETPCRLLTQCSAHSTHSIVVGYYYYSQLSPETAAGENQRKTCKENLI